MRAEVKKKFKDLCIFFYLDGIPVFFIGMDMVIAFQTFFKSTTSVFQKFEEDVNWVNLPKLRANYFFFYLLDREAIFQLCLSRPIFEPIGKI